MFKKLLSIAALSAIVSVAQAGSAQALGLTYSSGSYRDAATNEGAFSNQVNNPNYTTLDFNNGGVPGNDKVKYSFSGDGSYSTTAYSGQTGIYADQWAPSGVNAEVNTSKYLAVFQGKDTIIEAVKGTFNYFGFDAGALSVGNTIKFFNGDTLVKSMDYDEMNNLASVSASQHGGEKNAFFEIFARNKTENFNRVVLSQTTGGGFETDNHTFRVDPASVPEPGAILGLLAVGGMVVAKSKKQKTA
ncbi:PEP-CTERM sorting domain-containing protein [Calothrix sp. PCC 6303]|uniref:Npun_F0296 family exosortase-dependent surface protein n=1 Tax=Calothrix sp. PCC 6303 TaxID=1170562 RepID=UPI0002A02B03|nr:PEP-CTERM sorting domain-containing protein [Calothrix sp. PCC 6303]AFY99969.1 PEP motif putative anchor domain protein [Calothrix sp. PCC 6303]